MREGGINTWLCDPSFLDKIPEGLTYMVLTTDTGMPAPFTGKVTIATKNESVILYDQIFATAEFAPHKYPNGSLLIEEGMIFNWVTYVWEDPIPQISNSSLMAVAKKRGLIAGGTVG